MILGDIFDTVRPSPQIIAATGKALEGEVPVIILEGNHDQVSTQKGDHSLGPLGMSDNVIVVDEPTVWTSLGDGHQLTLVPHQPGPAKEWLPGVLADLNPPEGSMLCMHLGLMDDDVPPYMADVHDAIHYKTVAELCQKYGMRSAVSGNWHRRHFFKHDAVDVIQCGALVPTGFDNPGIDHYGTVLEWAGGNHCAHIELPGPRFLKFDTIEAAEKAIVDFAYDTKRITYKYADDWSLHVRVTVDPSEMSYLRDTAANLVKSY